MVSVSELSLLPLSLRFSIRDLKRNHDALVREVAAMALMNSALLDDLRAERRETLELLRTKGAPQTTTSPLADATALSAEAYGESLRQVQAELEEMEGAVEALRRKVEKLHETREGVEEAKMRTRMEHLALGNESQHKPESSDAHQSVEDTPADLNATHPVAEEAEDARRVVEVEKGAEDVQNVETEKENVEKKTERKVRGLPKTRGGGRNTMNDEQAAAKERLRVEAERATLGMTSPRDDWTAARTALMQLKDGPIATVKMDADSKRVLGTYRRDITRRVGQLTSDAASIALVSEQILDTITKPPLPEPLLLATLSSLSKALILQAETEVAIKSHAALPLAQLSVNLLSALPQLSDIFWARLVQRTGGWVVPVAVPAADVDGTVFSPEAYAKARGWKAGEIATYQAAQVAGAMRLYFAILWAKHDHQLERPFQRPRFWNWTARLVGTPELLATQTAADLLTVALDVGGTQALRVWGRQWGKMLEMLWDLAESGTRIGGEADGAAGRRARLMLAIECAMDAP